MQKKIELYECEIKQLKSQILNIYKSTPFNPKSANEESPNISRKPAIDQIFSKKPSNSLNQQGLHKLIMHANHSLSKSFNEKKSQDENVSLLGMDLITNFSESMVKSPRCQVSHSFQQNEHIRYSDLISFMQCSASALEEFLLIEN